MTKSADTTLKRFTSLGIAIDMLVERRITLVSPERWDDRNDVALLEAYRKRRGVEKLYAMCFTQAPETYHHWSVFAGGLEGVRVNIDKLALLSSLKDNPRYVWNDVEYLTLEKMKTYRKIDVFDIPFFKRYAFRDELEFRLLYECGDKKKVVHHVPVQLDWIKGITVSPWMPTNLVDSLKAAIHSINGCERIRVTKTSLRENDRWKNASRRIAEPGQTQATLPRNPINLDISLDNA